MRYIYEIPTRLPVFFSYPKNSVLHPVSKKIAARFAHQHSVLYHVSKPLQKGSLVQKDAKDFSNSRFCLFYIPFHSMHNQLVQKSGKSVV